MAVTVNYMCQPDRLSDEQGAGETLFLHVFVRVFLEEISTGIRKLRSPLPMPWASSNPWRVRLEQKGGGRVNSLSAVSWDIHLLSKDPGTPGS